MGRFLYFFPGCGSEGAARKTMIANGLDATIQTEFRMAGEIPKGPDGARGLMLTNVPAGVDPEALAYKPERQRWMELGEETFPFWLGYDEGAKPGPVDLVRPEMLEGYDVLLADGRPWRVPVARMFPDGATKLPVSMGFAAGGKVQKRVIGRYAALRAFAEGVYDAMQEGALKGNRYGFTATDEQLLTWVGAAISANYFAGQWELSVIEAFGTKEIADVLYALIDWPRYVGYGEVLNGKKNPSSDFYLRFDGFAGNFQSMFQA